MTPLPCCAQARPGHVRDLAHVYQFDFDLYQCPECERHWVWAWRAGLGGWESVTEQAASAMRAVDEADIRAFMKTWATDFR